MWSSIFGHDDVVARFRRTRLRGRLASTYLFVGPSGIGKRKFALELARALLCSETADADLDACGRCESCRLIAAGNHPDLQIVGLPADKSTLPISLFIGEKERRNQQGLCHDISLRPFLSRRKIAVIDDADHFSQESANCLLKTLEEPPAHSLLILIGTSPSRQLPTIRSRSQIVRFCPLDQDTVARILANSQAASDANRGAQMAVHGNGSVERAIALADPALWEFRNQIIRDLESRRPDSVRMARAVQAFVDEAGDESSAKRERLRTIISFAIDFYRASFALIDGSHTHAEAAGASAIDQANAKHCADGGDLAVRAIDCCLDTLEAIDRNANLGLAIQCWCEELTDLTMPQPR